MSTQKNTVKKDISYGPGYVIGENVVTNVIGKILTLIDILGLEQQQATSLRDMVVQETWGIINRQGAYINGKDHTELRNNLKSSDEVN